MIGVTQEVEINNDYCLLNHITSARAFEWTCNSISCLLYVGCLHFEFGADDSGENGRCRFEAEPETTRQRCCQWRGVRGWRVRMRGEGGCRRPRRRGVWGVIGMAIKYCIEIYWLIDILYLKKLQRYPWLHVNNLKNSLLKMIDPSKHHRWSFLIPYNVISLSLSPPIASAFAINVKHKMKERKMPPIHGSQERLSVAGLQHATTTWNWTAHAACSHTPLRFQARKCWLLIGSIHYIARNRERREGNTGTGRPQPAGVDPRTRCRLASTPDAQMSCKLQQHEGKR